MNAAKETTLNELAEMLSHVVEHMATKEDIGRLEGRLEGVETRLDKVEARLASIESALASIRRDLYDLQEKFENVSGFRKEIDHALERIATIEKKIEEMTA
jgi:chromosome segregation ATPase